LEPNQLNLFPDVKPTPAHRAEALVMSADTLLNTKANLKAGFIAFSRTLLTKVQSL
jgi:hypothetical protein